MVYLTICGYMLKLIASTPQPVQHVLVLNSISNCKTMVKYLHIKTSLKHRKGSVKILGDRIFQFHYKLMGPPSLSKMLGMTVHRKYDAKPNLFITTIISD